MPLRRRGHAGRSLGVGRHLDPDYVFVSERQATAGSALVDPAASTAAVYDLREPEICGVTLIIRQGRDVERVL